MKDQQQEEEREVLLSIYEGDTNFKELNNRYQYKYGEDGQADSFLLEIIWPEEYPSQPALCNMDTFYNTNLPSEFKQRVVDLIRAEAESLVGEAMTYTLIEKVRESVVTLTEGISFETSSAVDGNRVAVENDGECRHQEANLPNRSTYIAKESLTKAQKRRMWDKAEVGKSGKSRGSDWVDIIKHLSQTGHTT